MNSLLEKIKEAVDILPANNSNAKGDKDLVFFRGQMSEQKLKPSLWRCCVQDNISRIENQLYCDTYVICPDDSNFQNSWETLALMQHFGIPTRLLDWTSSLGNALFFALEKCLFCSESCENCNSKPAIWLLSPHKMHEHFYKDLLDSRVSITIGVDDFEDYKEFFLDNKISNKNAESNEKKWRWEESIFLEIPWRNLRIKSQKGFFTFHKTDKALETYKGNEKFLKKIQLDAQDIANAKDLIRLLDISAFDMYSDLPSLSKYLRSKYQL